MDIVQNILNIAKTNGLNNQQLCKLLNTNPNKIYDWKVGKSRPSAQDVLTIADYLNISVDYLLGISEETGAKKAPTDNDERDELIDAIMSIVKTLSPEQKQMLLAQLRGLAGQK